MPPAARSFTAIVAGMVVAVTCISASELIAAFFHPVPPGYDAVDPRQSAAYAASAPTASLVVLMIGWIVAAFAGGSIAARIADHKRAAFAQIISMLVLAVTILTFFALPRPMWMMTLSVVGIGIAGLQAARLAPPESAG